MHKRSNAVIYTLADIPILKTRRGWWKDKALLERVLESLQDGENLKDVLAAVGVSKKEWRYFCEIHPKFKKLRKEYKESLKPRRSGHERDHIVVFRGKCQHCPVHTFMTVIDSGPERGRGAELYRAGEKKYAEQYMGADFVYAPHPETGKVTCMSMCRTCKRGIDPAHIMEQLKIIIPKNLENPAYEIDRMPYRQRAYPRRPILYLWS